MSFMHSSFLFLLAILGGVLNSIAGGAGVILFPALLVTGLPSISANATNTVATLPGYVASIYVYRHELKTQWRISLLLGSISLIGGMLGAMLLLSMPNTSFDRLVPWFLLLATLLFTFSDSITTRLKISLLQVSQSQRSRRSLFQVLLIQFLIAIYGGFYGGGMSFLILAMLRIVGIKDIHKMNMLKIVLMGCIDSFAVITFIFANIVAWPQALLMMVGTFIGGFSGANLARYLKPSAVKRFVIVIGFATSAYFFLSK